jgi:PTS system ascorbate-specific IIA component
VSQLSDLIPPSAILLDSEAADWREAIRASGELLVAAGATEAAYTEAMIRTVEEHGPYIVIAPGFALAHSRPDASVHRTALSFVRLADPIAFGNAANDPVTLVMALAAADSSAHRAALASLAGVLADPERRRALDEARTSDQVLAALGADEVAQGPNTSAATPASAGSANTGSAADSADTASTATDAAPSADAATGATTAATAAAGAAAPVDADAVPSTHLLLTVCGNGLGTSLFLKNTAEQVLDRWGWSSYLDVQATDTISAKGRAKDSDAILTSGAIADTLGEVGVRVEVIENFTSQAEIDAALRRIYAV